MEYGLQLFSVRDITGADLEGALKAVAELGYSSVEYAGFFGHSAQQVAAWQEKYGLTCAGTHSGTGELLPENIDATIAYHKTIGNTKFIIPGEDLSTLEKIDRFASIVNAAIPKMAEAGIEVGYHNHSHEFVVMPWGSTIHSELEKRCNVFFEIDTYWAFNAGLDPIQVMNRLADRLRVIHLKDGHLGGQGKALGEGDAPVKAVRQRAIEMGIPMVVESETLTPTGIEEVERCIKFLRACDAED